MRQFKIIRLVVSFSLVVGVCFCRFFSSVEASQDQDSLAKSLTHYTLGMMHDLYGTTDKAIEEFKQASEYDPQRAVIYLRIGIDYARLGKLTEAIESLKVVNQLKPDELQAHYLLALIYSTQKDFEKSADEYEIILKHFGKAEPENIEIYGYLGQLYYSQNKFEKAAQQFKMILSLEPKNAEVLYVLGSLYLEMDQRGEAIQYFKQSVESDPQHGGSLNSLAYIYAEDGVNLDEALKLVQRALSIDPENGAYLDSLGWIYFKKGMYQQALENLKKADGILKDPVIYEHLGDVYLGMDEVDNAQKYWELSLKLFPDQKSVLIKLNNLKDQSSRKDVLSSQNLR